MCTALTQGTTSNTISMLELCNNNKKPTVLNALPVQDIITEHSHELVIAVYICAEKHLQYVLLILNRYVLVLVGLIKNIAGPVKHNHNPWHDAFHYHTKHAIAQVSPRSLMLQARQS